MKKVMKISLLIMVALLFLCHSGVSSFAATISGNDNYSNSTSEQYGIFRFTVPSSHSSFILRLETSAEFVIAEGSFWGECRGACGGISNINVVL